MTFAVKKIEVVLNYPKHWIKQYPDVGFLYETMLDYLKNHPKVTLKINDKFRKLIKTEGIFLGAHTRFTGKNVWNIKKGYLPGYFYFDKSGFSAWAHLAQYEDQYKDQIEKVSVEQADLTYRRLKSEYVDTKVSKWDQADTAFVPNYKYVFVATQVLNDWTQEAAYLKTHDMASAVIEAYRDTDTIVVIKIHPKAGSQGREFKEQNTHHKHVVFTDANIHEIIPGAERVYTCNSGVGLESLLHLKTVITTGDCDYKLCTHTCKTIEDIMKVRDKELVIDSLYIKKFLTFFFDEYLLDARTVKQIRNRLQTILALADDNR